MRLLFVGLVLLGLSACGGWSIRGTEGSRLPVEAVNLSAAGAPELGNAIRRRLIEFDIDLVKAADAEATIELRNEEFDRRVLSVDPETGKVREVELRLTAMLTVRPSDGTVAIGPERIQYERDYVFDEVSLLGTVEQESQLRRGLADDAALTILLRLESINPDP